MNSQFDISNLQKKWYGWIPTNLGELQFEYITQEQNQKTFPILSFQSNDDKNEIDIKIDTTKLSDSIKHHEILIKDSPWEELQAKVAYIHIKRQEKKFEGRIELDFLEVVMSATFLIELNGQVEFSNLEYSIVHPIENFDIDFHRLALYILVKSIIHGDNHHHQKIDVALKITIEQFDPNVILRNLLIHIKGIERNIKRLTGCSTKLAAQQAYHELEGYISYCKTFYEIFVNDDEEKKNPNKLYKNLESIKNSAKAKIDKIDKENTFTKSFFTTFLALIALFIAVNILNKPLSGELFHEHKSFYFLPIFLLLIVEWCYIDHLFRTKMYDDYELIKYLIYVDTAKLNTRGNINQKIILFLPVIAVLSSFIYGIYSLSPELINDGVKFFFSFFEELFSKNFFLTFLVSIIFGLWTFAAILGWRLNSK